MWRQGVGHELVRLEGVIRKVIEEAPQGSMTMKKARYELKALERVREDEANVAVRDEAQMQLMSRNVQEAAGSARAAAAEHEAATARLNAVRAQADGRLPPRR